MRIALARLAIDSGDGATTDAVYAWARSAGPGQVVPIKGMSGFDRSTPVDGPTFVGATEGGRKIKRGVRLWKVSVAVFKAETYRFLRLSTPTDDAATDGGAWPGGFVHLPKGTTAEWLRQRTAEQLVPVRTQQGFQKLEWQQMRERNEAFDSRVYSLADGHLYVCGTGGSWAAVALLPPVLAAIQSASLLGVGMEASAGTPFAAKLNAALWTALYAGDGGTGDLIATLNKEAGDDVGLILQTGFSTRALLDLFGSTTPVAPSMISPSRKLLPSAETASRSLSEPFPPRPVTFALEAPLARERLADSRTMKGGGTAGVATIGAAGVEIAQQTLPTPRARSSS